MAHPRVGDYMASVTVRIRGISNTVRNLAHTSDAIFDGALNGINDAASYLKNRIEDKFGSYQQTGGPGDGPWPRLKPATIRHKKTGDSPLYTTGNMAGSLYIEHGGKGRLSARVASSSSYIIHHIYGAPRGNVPKRDPFKVTAKEEADACRDIIMSHTYAALRKEKV